MKILGLDIGGANIKVSDADGNTTSIVFPMWTEKERLWETLTSLTAKDDPSPDMVALTMTAELADCFATKSEGVEFIIDAVEDAFPEAMLRVWLTSGEFAEADDAKELPMLVAAANWHALATWAGRAVPEGPAILIDMGSTTTDIIPLLDGVPVPAGLNDRDRLLSRELVYTGSYRTPICAITSEVPLRNFTCPLAAELFATIADALVVTGDMPEDSNRTDTADGRPLLQQNCRQRLARMLCCDIDELSEDDIINVAGYVVEQQRLLLQASVDCVLQQLATATSAEGRVDAARQRPVVLLSGSGSMVAKSVIETTDRLKDCEVLQLTQMFDRPIAEAACAFAVARLAHDLCRDELLPEDTAGFFVAGDVSEPL